MSSICIMKTFDILPLKEKADIVLKEGIYLNTVQHSIYQADLYAVKELFVEVLLFPPTRDFVHIRRVSDQGIQKYLEPIRLSL